MAKDFLSWNVKAFILVIHTSYWLVPCRFVIANLSDFCWDSVSLLSFVSKLGFRRLPGPRLVVERLILGTSTGFTAGSCFILSPSSSSVLMGSTMHLKQNHYVKLDKIQGKTHTSGKDLVFDSLPSSSRPSKNFA